MNKLFSTKTLINIIIILIIIQFLIGSKGENILGYLTLAFTVLTLFVYMKEKNDNKLMPEEIKIWMGKKVKVVMDRPLGTKHPDPRFETIYPVNYGFIPDTLSEADNEEIDAYILGPTEPLKEFEGIVIAGIKRDEDGEIKLIVTDGKDYTISEIEKLTYFQEKYHKSKVYK